MSSHEQGPQWGPPPEGNQPKLIKIASPKWGIPIRMVILSDSCVGVWTHHYDKRTRPCMGKQGRCEGHDRNIPARWKGYLAALEPTHGRLYLAELTHGCVQQCPALYSEESSLRGMLILLERTAKAPNSKVFVELTAPKVSSVNLTAAFDVRAALHRIWFGPHWEEEFPLVY
jgi:hypothetical protein